MGQVYMGVPCVVGGALSNVALKYLTPAGSRVRMLNG